MESSSDVEFDLVGVRVHGGVFSLLLKLFIGGYICFCLICCGWNLRGKDNTHTTQNFIFGVKKDSKENGETKSNLHKTNGFTFGGKKDTPKTTSSNTASFKFGTEKVESKATLSQFDISTPGNKKRSSYFIII